MGHWLGDLSGRRVAGRRASLAQIKGAKDAAIKAESIVEAFNEAEGHTDGLWNVDQVNRHIVDITSSARAAREYLESAGGES